MCYTKALELDPDYLYAYFFKGQSLHDLGKTDDAKVVIQAGIAAANKINDGHAVSELSGLLESMA